MNGAEYKTVPTSAEVWAVIHSRHPELKVFASYSAPDGDEFGNRDQGVMFTSYGFLEGDYPIMEARTMWDIDRESQAREKKEEKHEYWLCVPIKDEGE